MQNHLKIDDIERYITASTSQTDLDWFEETLEHVMDCQFCQQKISTRLKIEEICDEDGIALSIGLKELHKKEKRNIVDSTWGGGADDMIFAERYSSPKIGCVAASQMTPNYLIDDGQDNKSDVPKCETYESQLNEGQNNKKENKKFLRKLFSKR